MLSHIRFALAGHRLRPTIELPNWQGRCCSILVQWRILRQRVPSAMHTKINQRQCYNNQYHIQQNRFAAFADNKSHRIYSGIYSTATLCFAQYRSPSRAIRRWP